MINATLMGHDGEVFHTWSGPTLYDVIHELNEFLARGQTGLVFASTLSASELQIACRKELDDTILKLTVS